MVKQFKRKKKKKNKNKANEKDKKEFKAKKDFGLFPITHTLENLVSTLLNNLSILKIHVFTAHHQLHAQSTAKNKLSKDTITLTGDYQRNIEVEHFEKPMKTETKQSNFFINEEFPFIE